MKYSRIKKYILIFIYLIIFLVIIPITIYFINEYLYSKQIKYINKLKKYKIDNSSVDVKLDNNDYSINSNNTKIMQLTDIHLGCGIFSYRKDRLAIKAITKMIIKEKPNLIIITGDISYPIFFQSGCVSNIRCFKMINTLFNNLEVYYSFTFGNHDDEIYCVNTKYDIVNYFKKNKTQYCLFNHNYKVEGINQFIKIYKDNVLIKLLILLDTHSYPKGNLYGLNNQYDYIKDSQVNLVVNKIKQNNLVKSLLFIHIPIHEYSDNINDLKISIPIRRSNIFNELTKIKSLQAVFCGHDHNLSYSINYKNVLLTFCKPIDYIAYFNLIKDNRYRGCNIIDLKLNKIIFKKQNYHTKKYQNIILKV